MALNANSNSLKVYNGFNRFNPNRPFLIGVAGGTASGKVIFLHIDFMIFKITMKEFVTLYTV